jgi:hypothetical protein
MANVISATYSFTLPEVGADTNAWGGHLNGNFSIIDSNMLSRAFTSAQTMLGALNLPSNGLNVGSGQLQVSGGNVLASGNIASSAQLSGANAVILGTTTTGVLAASGNATVGGTLGVTGAATFGSTGSFAGVVTASAAPTLGGHLANKTYVDAQDALRLPLTGGTLSGNLAIVNGTTQMRLTLGSSGGYFYGEATQAGWANSAGTARVSWNISTGDFTAAGNVTAYSDARLKENVQTIQDAVSLTKRLRGVFYDRIDTGEHGVGVIAQELREVLPQVVSDNDGTLSVAYGNLVGVLIEAVKELSARVEALEGK